MHSSLSEAGSGYEDDALSEASLHSDALDESDHQKKERKRRRVQSPVQMKVKRGKTSKPGKSRSTPATKKRKIQVRDDDEEQVSDLDLKEGQEVVGKVIEAPKTGWAAKGEISQHTLNFLAQLRNPECNDRTWFKLHEAVYRACEKEFKHFIERFGEMLVRVDSQIPVLPPKDVVHRIYRDVRFSNDKTPYKRGLSASFSRSGRKGIFAFYHILIKPGDESLLAAGVWCPGKDELSTIRNHILHSSDRLREVISHPDFVSHFGEPRPHPKGKRQSIFGHDDELKTAPKGVDKHHRDIDLLKCRSLAVSRTFMDEQVLKPTFIEELEKVSRVLRPFVHCLNDIITLPVGSDSEDEQ